MGSGAARMGWGATDTTDDDPAPEAKAKARRNRMADNNPRHPRQAMNYWRDLCNWTAGNEEVSGSSGIGILFDFCEHLFVGFRHTFRT